MAGVLRRRMKFNPEETEKYQKVQKSPRVRIESLALTAGGVNGWRFSWRQMAGGVNGRRFLMAGFNGWRFFNDVSR